MDKMRKISATEELEELEKSVNELEQLVVRRRLQLAWVIFALILLVAVQFLLVIGLCFPLFNHANDDRWFITCIIHVAHTIVGPDLHTLKNKNKGEPTKNKVNWQITHSSASSSNYFDRFSHEDDKFKSMDSDDDFEKEIAEMQAEVSWKIK